MYYLIMCRSLTYAQRIEKALSSAGLRPRLLRAPAEISPKGCSYAVRIPDRQLSGALTVLRRTRLPYLGIYVGGPGEHWREVPS